MDLTTIYKNLRKDNPDRNATETLSVARNRVKNKRPYYSHADSYGPANRDGLRGLTYESALPRGAYEDATRRDNVTGFYADSIGMETFIPILVPIPGKNGQTRFLSGYRASDSDGFAVDCSTVYADSDPDLAKREASRAAYAIAERQADLAREYDSAWHAGKEWADKKAEKADLEKRIAGLTVALIRDSNADDSITEALVDARADAIEQARAIKSDMIRLAKGNTEGFMFYPSDELRAAFNDGAGETVLTK